MVTAKEQAQLGVRIPRELIKKARLAAISADTSLQAFVQQALENALKNKPVLK